MYLVYSKFLQVTVFLNCFSTINHGSRSFQFQQRFPHHLPAPINSCRLSSLCQKSPYLFSSPNCHPTPKPMPHSPGFCYDSSSLTKPTSFRISAASYQSTPNLCVLKEHWLMILQFGLHSVYHQILCWCCLRSLSWLQISGPHMGPKVQEDASRTSGLH